MRPEGADAIAFYDLSSAPEPVRVRLVVTRPPSAPAVFTAPDTLLAVSADQGFAVATRTGVATSIGGVVTYALSRDRRLLVTSDAAGRVTGRDPATFAARWTFDFGERPKALRFLRDDRLAIEGEARIVLVDAADGRSLLDSPYMPGRTDAGGDSVALSRSGRYAGVRAGVGGGGEVRAVELASGRVLARVKNTTRAPMFAFSADEKKFVVSDLPSLLEVFDLPGGARTAVKTRLSAGDENESYATDVIGFSEDGATICLHALATNRRSTCHVDIAADIGKRPPSPHEKVDCFLVGDHAEIVRIPLVGAAHDAIAPGGRALMGNSVGVGTSWCNGAPSADGSFVAYIEAREKADHTQYVDPQLVVWDARAAAIRSVVPFNGSMATVYGGGMWIALSEDGRFATVQFGSASSLLDLGGGRAVPETPVRSFAAGPKFVDARCDRVYAPDGVLASPYCAGGIDAGKDPIVAPQPAAIAPLAKGAWAVWLPDGRVEIVGDVAAGEAAAASALGCASGDGVEPFATCERDLRVRGAVRLTPAR
jgi:hypothetical protein